MDNEVITEKLINNTCTVLAPEFLQVFLYLVLILDSSQDVDS
jgi:hypothetical protein